MRHRDIQHNCYSTIMSAADERPTFIATTGSQTVQSWQGVPHFICRRSSPGVGPKARGWWCCCWYRLSCEGALSRSLCSSCLLAPIFEQARSATLTPALPARRKFSGRRSLHRHSCDAQKRMLQVRGFDIVCQKGARWCENAPGPGGGQADLQADCVCAHCSRRARAVHMHGACAYSTIHASTAQLH